MPHHRRESFRAYTVFQRRDYKGTPEIVEPDFRVLGLFQAPAQQLPDCRRASASSFGGWNNPAGIHPLPVSPHLLCRSERGSDGADSGIRFGLGYAPMFVLALFSHDVQRISLSLRIRLFTTLVLSSRTNILSHLQKGLHHSITAQKLSSHLVNLLCLVLTI